MRLGGLAGGVGRLSAQSPLGFLGEQSIGDWAQRTGAQEWSRRVQENGGKRVERPEDILVPGR